MLHQAYSRTAQLGDEVLNDAFLLVDLFNIAFDLLRFILDVTGVVKRLRVAFLQTILTSSHRCQL